MKNTYPVKLSFWIDPGPTPIRYFEWLTELPFVPISGHVLHLRVPGSETADGMCRELSFDCGQVSYYPLSGEFAVAMASPEPGEEITLTQEEVGRVVEGLAAIGFTEVRLPGGDRGTGALPASIIKNGPAQPRST